MHDFVRKVDLNNADRRIAPVGPRPPSLIPLPSIRPVAPAPFEASSAPATTRDLDHAFRAGIARLTGGLAPTALAGAYFDWAVHLAASPGKQLELAGQAVAAAVDGASFAARCARGGSTDPCGCA
jgi:polyhydroxyalkanoate synthase